jgi:hypothetical protein
MHNVANITVTSQLATRPVTERVSGARGAINIAQPVVRNVRGGDWKILQRRIVAAVSGVSCGHLLFSF